MGNAADGAPAAQAHATMNLIPLAYRPTEATRDTARPVLALAAESAPDQRLRELGYVFAYVADGSSVWGMGPELEESVKLVDAKLADGSLITTQLFNAFVSPKQYQRIKKVVKFSKLQEYGLDGLLTSAYIDAWGLKTSDQMSEKEEEDYAESVGKHLLRDRRGARALMLKSLLKATDRVVFGKGDDAGNFTFPDYYYCQQTTEEGFFLNKEAVRQQLPSLVNVSLPDFIDDEEDEEDVRSWVDADGKSSRLYCLYHGNLVIGFLYRNLMRVFTRMEKFYQAYGMLPQYQGTGMGSALLYCAMKDMKKIKYIIIDVDAQHPASLACFRRAAGVHDRHLDALGRYIAATNTFELNRRPRKGETTRWCLRLKGAPERFPGRLPRGRGLAPPTRRMSRRLWCMRIMRGRRWWRLRSRRRRRSWRRRSPSAAGAASPTECSIRRSPRVRRWGGQWGGLRGGKAGVGVKFDAAERVCECDFSKRRVRMRELVNFWGKRK